MENAKLGDSMVERLRAEGTAAEAEKEAAMSEYIPVCVSCTHVLQRFDLPPH